jgi:hypothetical protein
VRTSSTGSWGRDSREPPPCCRASCCSRARAADPDCARRVYRRDPARRRGRRTAPASSRGPRRSFPGRPGDPGLPGRRVRVAGRARSRPPRHLPASMREAPERWRPRAGSRLRRRSATYASLTPSYGRIVRPGYDGTLIQRPRFPVPYIRNLTRSRPTAIPASPPASNTTTTQNLRLVRARGTALLPRIRQPNHSVARTSTSCEECAGRR